MKTQEDVVSFLKSEALKYTMNQHGGRPTLTEADAQRLLATCLLLHILPPRQKEVKE
jgi:hypothetical protein